MTATLNNPSAVDLTKAVAHEHDQLKRSKAIYWIEGLFCGNCASALEHKIAAVKMVESASVNFTYSYMIIDYLGDIATLNIIEKTVKNLGYKITSASLDVRQQQLVQQKKQAYSTLFFAFIFSMWSMLTAIVTYLHGPDELSHQALNLLNIFSGIFSIPVVFSAGFHFHKMAWYALKGRLFNIDLLISTSALLAFFVSCYFLWWQIDIVYFDTACMLILLHLFGRTLDLNTKTKAMECLQEEIELSQSSTVLYENSVTQLEKVALNTISQDDILVIHLGEVIPIDCELLSEFSLCDVGVTTGESTPVEYLKQSELAAGFVNLGQTIRVRAKCSAGQSNADYQLTAILMNKAKQVSNSVKINRLSSWLSQLIFFSALTAGIYVFVVYSDLQLAFERMLCVLVIACPCSLTIAVPLASLILNQQSIKKKLVINNYAAFAEGRHLSAFYFDKTGTLTQGRPALMGIKKVHNNLPLEQVLQHAYQCVYYSGHIYSDLIRQHISENILPVREHGAYNEVLGYGVQWTSDDGKLHVALGSKKWFVEQQISIEDSENNTASYLVINNELVAIFEFEDSLKTSAEPTIKYLTTQLPYIAMLSGDNQATCQNIAQQLGVNNENIYSEKNPEQKQAEITRCQNNQQVVGFIGDGLNDNLALMQADVGVATKSANALTKMSATVCLLSNDLTTLRHLKPLAQLYHKLMKYNLVYAVVYNMIAIPIALFGNISPLIAISAMVASSFSVSINSYFFSKKMDEL
jgi:heavy metal translocating P-type ATPase